MANIIIKRYGKIKPPLGAFLDRGHPLAQGMVGGWLFNEGGGNQVLDITGNANYGILTNMDPPTDWVGGPHGPALDFDGSNDYIITPNNIIHNIGTGDFTWIVNVLPRVINTTWGGAISISAGGVVQAMYACGINSTTQWGAYIGGAGRASGNTLDANKWYQLVFLRSEGTLKFYQNGVQTPDTFSVSVSLNNGQFYIGLSPSLRYLNGLVEYVYFYSRALTPDQIAYLYQEPFAMIKAPGPARYFSIAAGGPFLLNVAGAMASSGSILNQPRRGWDGAMASSGLLIDKAGKIVAGSMSSSGLLSGESRKVFAGAMSSSGSLTILATRLVALAGSMVSAGAILLQPRKLFTGAMSGVGTLTKRSEKVLSGAMASSGAASQLITKVIALLGSMASAGGLLLRPGKVISGTMSSAGTLVKSPNKTLSGAMASSGEVKKELRLIFNGIMASSGNALKQAGKLFSGAMGSSGIAAHSLTRILTIAGSMVSSGVLQKSIRKLLDSSMTSSGILSKSVSKVLVGILTSIGTALLQVTGRAIQIFYQLDVEAQNRIDNVEIQDRIVTVEAQKRIDTILK